MSIMEIKQVGYSYDNKKNANCNNKLDTPW